MDVPETDPDCPSCRALLKIIAQQQEQIDRLRSRVELVDRLQAQIKALEGRLAQVEREGKRQAAPFRKPTKPQHKRPGRKGGGQYGEHHRRAVPQRIDESYEVPLPGGCGHCGCRELAPAGSLVQYQLEIPRQIIYRRFRIARGTCRSCGRAVRGRHALQTSEAAGAAGVQLGPNTHAAIALLNKELGLSHGKVRRLMHMLFGISIGRSTSCRSVLRTGRLLEGAHEQVRAAIRGSPQAAADETGWRLGGRSAWLHVLAAPSATCYEIAPTRGRSVAERVLGDRWQGVLVHDGWAPYDALDAVAHQQCLAHLLRRCEGLLEQARGRACALPAAVAAALGEALRLRNRHRTGELSARGLRSMAGRLQRRVWGLVYHPKAHAGNERLCKFLFNHLEELFTFLRHPGVDATNWRAEQAIRPAVVNRKVWGGNRTEAGALAQSRVMSVMQTCKQRLFDPLEFIRSQLTSVKPLALPLPVLAVR